MHADGFAGARLLQLHAAPEFSGTQAQERHAVAMVRVHVRLHLEHEARHFVFRRRDFAGLRRLWARRRRIFGNRTHQFAHAEILECAAEEDGCQMARAIDLGVEVGTGAAGQRDIFQQLRLQVFGQYPGQRFAADALVLSEHGELIAQQIEDALEVQPHADRPYHRRAIELELVGNFVHQFEWIARLAIHLVDEGHDWDIAQPAHFEQLTRLAFDAAGGVDHHHRGIGGGQRAIGVFAEIFVAGRIEQIEDRVRIFERHHRTRHRDAAFLLDFHPVRARAPRIAARLHLPRHADRAAQQQQMLGQGRLARVRMRNDRKCAPSRSFRCGRIGMGCGRRTHRGRGVAGTPPPRKAAGMALTTESPPRARRCRGPPTTCRRRHGRSRARRPGWACWESEDRM